MQVAERLPVARNRLPLDHPALRLADAGGLVLQDLDSPGDVACRRTIHSQSRGLGEILPSAPTEYEHAWAHAGTAVIGGGWAGMQAALAAAEGGEQVILIDDQRVLGGQRSIAKVRGRFR